MNTEGWQSVLKLSTMWEFIEMRNVAIEALDAIRLSPIDKVLFGREFGVYHWLSEGYVALAKDSATISNHDSEKLGWETATRLLRVRDMQAAKPRPPASNSCCSAAHFYVTLRCTNCDRLWNSTELSPVGSKAKASSSSVVPGPKPVTGVDPELLSALRIEFQQELAECEEADKLMVVDH